MGVGRRCSMSECFFSLILTFFFLWGDGTGFRFDDAMRRYADLFVRAVFK